MTGTGGLDPAGLDRLQAGHDLARAARHFVDFWDAAYAAGTD